MWDGREPSLASQATDATLGHAQGDNPPTPEQQQQIVAFESGLFTAQLFDSGAKYLNSTGASGGPEALSNQLSLYLYRNQRSFWAEPNRRSLQSKYLRYLRCLGPFGRFRRYDCETRTDCAR
jgi:hypothetical protein